MRRVRKHLFSISGFLFLSLALVKVSYFILLSGCTSSKTSIPSPSENVSLSVDNSGRAPFPEELSHSEAVFKNPADKMLPPEVLGEVSPLKIIPPVTVVEDIQKEDLDWGRFSNAIKKDEDEFFHLILDSKSFRGGLQELEEHLRIQGFIEVQKTVVVDKMPKKLELSFQRDQQVVRLRVEQKVLGRAALVIDDIGNNKKILSFLDETRSPITLAILPRLIYSQTLSRELHDRGYEVMLHLPMENLSGRDPGPGVIKTSMEEAEIRKIMNDDLETVPNAVGVNNHMGSKVTRDVRVMEIVLDELERRHLFFLDSLTTRSVTKQVADKKGWKIHSRDVFLDDDNKTDSIEHQLESLKNHALRTGKVIGIGHPLSATMQVLRQGIPRLEDEGIQFVFLSQWYQEHSESRAPRSAEES